MAEEIACYCTHAGVMAGVEIQGALYLWIDVPDMGEQICVLMFAKS